MNCPVGTDIDYAASLLAAGQLVAFGTETVYGLGAHALDPQAVAGIFAAKERPKFDPLIVHVVDRNAAESLVRDWPASAVQLAEKFWPGPLTLVLPKQPIVPDLVTAGLDTVAIRVPAHPPTRELLQRVKLPIAAPSANRFGSISPTTAEHVRAGLGDRIDYILDCGPCTVGIESTVVGFDGEQPVLLRPGGIGLEELEEVVGQVGVVEASSESDQPVAAPGMLSRHYAPRTPLLVWDESSPFDVEGKRLGLLTLSRVPDALRPHDFESVEVLSSGSDLLEAAANFFAALRRLDESGGDLILATSFPDQGLGRALNDRLRRASQSA
ncbi:L-threonylcarbamoyladenylate synthase [Calycomorphotria hydatis]|uniref:Threonylcarbamoyl-AMP synthase n=1 Tax=Calycomorphotria hydatis TaxID=2528027 RepID=A0A517TCQ8_9PLAN|nr:L-threonylcarbamoyladenylate synthase [Calycomorphotria hydatis]QDT66156.1 Threonylcarbamoyl-AMP synthase [Calycomorphotria hydatis]